jgi:hypothetical protein
VIIATASSPEETTPNPTTPDTSSDRNSIGFLLNCPSERDFIEEFPKSTTLSPNSKPEGYSSSGPSGQHFHHMGDIPDRTSVYREYGHMIQENNIDVFLSHLDFSNFEQQTNNWQMPGENLILWSGSDRFLDRGVFEQKAFQIRSTMKHTSEIMNPPHSPPAEIVEALELITADNIAAWIKLYFRHWHKHAPMVHEATFDPCNAACPLILSLMSLGAMVSHRGEQSL